MKTHRLAGMPLWVALSLLVGCAERPETQPADTDPPATGQAPSLPGEPFPERADQEPRLRLEVDLTSRELHVIQDGRRTASHPVAVGSEEWPTPTGEWTIGQVVWNPRWVPPDQEWAEDEEEKEPGDPENPLGRAQLVYDLPNTVHGTNEPASLGQAVSHGSLRVSNEVAMTLARLVMEAGGASRDEAWYERVRAEPTQHEIVTIPDPVPIRVYGDAGAEPDR